MEAQNRAANLGVVILAAGRSRRMGRPKLLLPWGGTSVLGHQIETWRALGAGQIAVVCATDDAAMSAELTALNFPAANRIQNPDPEQGMFSSVVCAARWNGWHAELTRWAITLGDQPHLKIETLHTLLKFSAANPERVCQPRRLDHLRHPVILPKQFFRALGQTPALTMKDFLKAIPEGVSACDVDDAGLDLDLDTPDDYERALEIFFSKIGSGAH
jgi:molybdenum cofactor cytidylyltransferase